MQTIIPYGLLTSDVHAAGDRIRGAEAEGGGDFGPTLGASGGEQRYGGDQRVARRKVWCFLFSILRLGFRCIAYFICFRPLGWIPHSKEEGVRVVPFILMGVSRLNTGGSASLLGPPFFWPSESEPTPPPPLPPPTG